MTSRWIYISPHLDDAVLSCGGLIWEQTQAGIPVEIWTIVCGIPEHDELSPYAQLMHQQWGTTSAAQTVNERRAEDAAAAEVVGAKAVHFDVPDCIYRRSADGGWLYEDIFVPPHPAEAELPRRVTKVLSERLKPDDVVVCPLTLGQHVDHTLIRMAVEQLERDLLYYADIPYLLKAWPSLLSFIDGMSGDVHKVSEQGLRAWQRGIAAYTSQLGMLFETEEMMRQTIKSYWESTFGLMLWHVE